MFMTQKQQKQPILEIHTIGNDHWQLTSAEFDKKVEASIASVEYFA